MTEQEVYLKIKPLIEGHTEGLFWDFKKTLRDSADIIKDILAFSNSNYTGDSYIIVGVSEPASPQDDYKIALSTEDRRRLNTDANYLYLPGEWELHGLSADDLTIMKQFSARLSQQIECSMLISQPQCEFVPVIIGKKRWLYVIVVKQVPGVFISKKDIIGENNGNKAVVKQGVLYVRIADTTIGAEPNIASATEHIRVWKEYIDWLRCQDAVSQEEVQEEIK